jgi:hypothetical protein
MAIIQAFPALGADGDEIGAQLGIIVPFQADGTMMVFVGIDWSHRP